MTEPAPIDQAVEVESPLQGAVSYLIDRQINLAQLEAEIVSALGLKPEQVVVALTGPEHHDQPISQDNPVWLWLRPPSADAAKVAAAIEAHQIDASWGIPNVLSAFDEVWARVIADPDKALASLTAKDSKALLVGLAVKFHAQSVVSVSSQLTLQ